MKAQQPPPNSARNAGILYALLAFGSWGVIPLFWKGFGSTPAAEVISHRLVWSLVFLLILVFARREGRECLRILRNPRLLGVFFGTASLLSVNWGLFVHAVNANRIVEASLGYFINPLLNVLLGAVVLRERLSRWQAVAVALASIGVVIFGWHLAHIPWIALGVAFTFALYALLRKLVPVSPLPGLAIETALITPVALVWIALGCARGDSHFAGSPALAALFVCSGAITVVPLLWFISSARLLPLSTMGFLQYLAPTLQLLVGIVIYHEPFTLRHGVAFGFIWGAIAIFLGAATLKKRVRLPATPDIPGGGLRDRPDPGA